MGSDLHSSLSQCCGDALSFHVLILVLHDSLLSMCSRPMNACLALGYGRGAGGRVQAVASPCRVTRPAGWRAMSRRQPASGRPADRESSESDLPPPSDSSSYRHRDAGRDTESQLPHDDDDASSVASDATHRSNGSSDASSVPSARPRDRRNPRPVQAAYETQRGDLTSIPTLEDARRVIVGSWIAKTVSGWYQRVAQFWLPNHHEVPPEVEEAYRRYHQEIPRLSIRAWLDHLAGYVLAMDGRDVFAVTLEFGIGVAERLIGSDTRMSAYERALSRLVPAAVGRNPYTVEPVELRKTISSYLARETPEKDVVTRAIIGNLWHNIRLKGHGLAAMACWFGADRAELQGALGLSAQQVAIERVTDHLTLDTSILGVLRGLYRLVKGWTEQQSTYAVHARTMTDRWLECYTEEIDRLQEEVREKGQKAAKGPPGLPKDRCESLKRRFATDEPDPMRPFFELAFPAWLAAGLKNVSLQQLLVPSESLEPLIPLAPDGTQTSKKHQVPERIDGVKTRLYGAPMTILRCLEPVTKQEVDQNRSNRVTSPWVYARNVEGFIEELRKIRDSMQAELVSYKTALADEQRTRNARSAPRQRGPRVSDAHQLTSTSVTRGMQICQTLAICNSALRWLTGADGSALETTLGVLETAIRYKARLHDMQHMHLGTVIPTCLWQCGCAMVGRGIAAVPHAGCNPFRAQIDLPTMLADPRGLKQAAHIEIRADTKHGPSWELAVTQNKHVPSIRRSSAAALDDVPLGYCADPIHEGSRLYAVWKIKREHVDTFKSQFRLLEGAHAGGQYLHKVGSSSTHVYVVDYATLQYHVGRKLSYKHSIELDISVDSRELVNAKLPQVLAHSPTSVTSWCQAADLLCVSGCIPAVSLQIFGGLIPAVLFPLQIPFDATLDPNRRRSMIGWNNANVHTASGLTPSGSKKPRKMQEPLCATFDQAATALDVLDLNKLIEDRAPGLNMFGAPELSLPNRLRGASYPNEPANSLEYPGAKNRMDLRLPPPDKAVEGDGLLDPQEGAQHSNGELRDPREDGTLGDQSPEAGLGSTIPMTTEQSTTTRSPMKSETGPSVKCATDTTRTARTASSGEESGGGSAIGAADPSSAPRCSSSGPAPDRSVRPFPDSRNPPFRTASSEPDLCTASSRRSETGSSDVSWEMPPIPVASPQSMFGVLASPSSNVLQDTTASVRNPDPPVSSLLREDLLEEHQRRLDEEDAQRRTPVEHHMGQNAPSSEWKTEYADTGSWLHASDMGSDLDSLDNKLTSASKNPALLQSPVREPPPDEETVSFTLTESTMGDRQTPGPLRNETLMTQSTTKNTTSTVKDTTSTAKDTKSTTKDTTNRRLSFSSARSASPRTPACSTRMENSPDQETGVDSTRIRLEPLSTASETIQATSPPEPSCRTRDRRSSSRSPRSTQSSHGSDLAPNPTDPAGMASPRNPPSERSQSAASNASDLPSADRRDQPDASGREMDDLSIVGWTLEVRLLLEKDGKFLIRRRGAEQSAGKEGLIGDRIRVGERPSHALARALRNAHLGEQLDGDVHELAAAIASHTPFFWGWCRESLHLTTFAVAQLDYVVRDDISQQDWEDVLTFFDAITADGLVDMLNGVYGDTYLPEWVKEQLRVDGANRAERLSYYLDRVVSNRGTASVDRDLAEIPEGDEEAETDDAPRGDSRAAPTAAPSVPAPTPSAGPAPAPKAKTMPKPSSRTDNASVLGLASNVSVENSGTRERISTENYRYSRRGNADDLAAAMADAAIPDADPAMAAGVARATEALQSNGRIQYTLTREHADLIANPNLVERVACRNPECRQQVRMTNLPDLVYACDACGWYNLPSSSNRSPDLVLAYQRTPPVEGAGVSYCKDCVLECHRMYNDAHPDQTGMVCVHTHSARVSFEEMREGHMPLPYNDEHSGSRTQLSVGYEDWATTPFVEENIPFHRPTGHTSFVAGIATEQALPDPPGHVAVLAPTTEPNFQSWIAIVLDGFDNITVTWTEDTGWVSADAWSYHGRNLLERVRDSKGSYVEDETWGIGHGVAMVFSLDRSRDLIRKREKLVLKEVDGAGTTRTGIYPLHPVDTRTRPILHTMYVGIMEDLRVYGSAGLLMTPWMKSLLQADDSVQRHALNLSSVYREHLWSGMQGNTKVKSSPDSLRTRHELGARIHRHRGHPVETCETVQHGDLFAGLVNGDRSMETLARHLAIEYAPGMAKVGSTGLVPGSKTQARIKRECKERGKSWSWVDDIVRLMTPGLGHVGDLLMPVLLLRLIVLAWRFLPSLRTLGDLRVLWCAVFEDHVLTPGDLQRMVRVSTHETDSEENRRLPWHLVGSWCPVPPYYIVPDSDRPKHVLDPHINAFAPLFVPSVTAGSSTWLMTFGKEEDDDQSGISHHHCSPYGAYASRIMDAHSHITRNGTHVPEDRAVSMYLYSFDQTAWRERKVVSRTEAVSEPGLIIAAAGIHQEHEVAVGSLIESIPKRARTETLEQLYHALGADPVPSGPEERETLHHTATTAPRGSVNVARPRSIPAEVASIVRRCQLITGAEADFLAIPSKGVTDEISAMLRELVDALMAEETHVKSASERRTALRGMIPWMMVGKPTAPARGVWAARPETARSAVAMTQLLEERGVPHVRLQRVQEVIVNLARLFTRATGAYSPTRTVDVHTGVRWMDDRGWKQPLPMWVWSNRTPPAGVLHDSSNPNPGAHWSTVRSLSQVTDRWRTAAEMASLASREYTQAPTGLDLLCVYPDPDEEREDRGTVVGPPLRTALWGFPILRPPAHHRARVENLAGMFPEPLPTTQDLWRAAANNKWNTRTTGMLSQGSDTSLSVIEHLRRTSRLVDVVELLPYLARPSHSISVNQAGERVALASIRGISPADPFYATSNSPIAGVLVGIRTGPQILSEAGVFTASPTHGLVAFGCRCCRGTPQLIPTRVCHNAEIGLGHFTRVYMYLFSNLTREEEVLDHVVSTPHVQNMLRCRYEGCPSGLYDFRNQCEERLLGGMWIQYVAGVCRFVFAQDSPDGQRALRNLYRLAALGGDESHVGNTVLKLFGHWYVWTAQHARCVQLCIEHNDPVSQWSISIGSDPGIMQETDVVAWMTVASMVWAVVAPKSLNPIGLIAMDGSDDVRSALVVRFTKHVVDTSECGLVAGSSSFGQCAQCLNPVSTIEFPTRICVAGSGVARVHCVFCTALTSEATSNPLSSETAERMLDNVRKARQTLRNVYSIMVHHLHRRGMMEGASDAEITLYYSPSRSPNHFELAAQYDGGGQTPGVVLRALARNGRIARATRMNAILTSAICLRKTGLVEEVDGMPAYVQTACQSAGRYSTEHAVPLQEYEPHFARYIDTHPAMSVP